MPVVSDYTALLSGSYWNGIEVTNTPVIVTFSFPSAAPAYDSSIDGFTAGTTASFSPFTAAEQTQAIAALNEWAAASGLVFVESAPGTGDINFQNVNFNTTVATATTGSYAGFGGIAFYPFGGWNNFSYPNFQSDLDSSGDVFMNSQFQNGDGTVAYGTLLHEIGHAIGLKHPTQVWTDYAAEPAPVVHDQVLAADDPSLTIMAQTGDANTAANAHLLPLDQSAAAFIYGAAGTGGVYTGSASGTNSVSSWSWNAATLTMTQTAVADTGETIRGTSVNDVINGSPDGADRLFALGGNDIVHAGNGNNSIYGGTGNDTLTAGTGNNNYYVNGPNTTITQQAGGFNAVYATVSYALPSNIQSLSLYGQGLTGRANNQGDSLFGDGTFATTLIGGTGNDYIVGGTGDDTIAGGGGIDLMYGGAGANIFVFSSAGDAAPGASLTTIGDFTSTQGDKIDLSAIKTAGGQALHFIGTAAFSGTPGEVDQATINGNPVLEGDVNGDGTADFQIGFFNPAQGAPIALQASDLLLSAACYRAGTRILTAAGEVPIEHLAIGDQVMTLAGLTRAVRWIGHRRIDCRSHPAPETVWPVRVLTGAFGEGIPHRDLFLSPDHAVFLDGSLIPIKLLVNGASIVQRRVETVTWFHVELDRHDIVFAEGLPAESYLDTGNRAWFANGGTVTSLHPRLTPPEIRSGQSAAPLLTEATHLRPIWNSLAGRARSLGLTGDWVSETSDPAVRLIAGGRTIRPILTEAGHLRFILPHREGNPRLVSRARLAAEQAPWAGDARRLGVCVSRIVWHGRNQTCDLALDNPALGHGWWRVEWKGAEARRWTNGDAIVPLPAAARMVDLCLAGTMRYRQAAGRQSSPSSRRAISSGS